MKDRVLDVGEILRDGDFVKLPSGTKIKVHPAYFGEKVMPQNSLSFPHGYYRRPLKAKEVSKPSSNTSYTSALREKLLKYYPSSDRSTANNFIKSVQRLNASKEKHCV